MKRVAVAGATGYSGAELAAILSRHEGAEVVALCSSSGGASLAASALHPAIRRGTPDVEPFVLDRLLDLAPDTVFLATPNEASAEIAPKLRAAGVGVIDLSGSFRLRSADDYPRWYGFDHPAPALLAESVYGLTEQCNGELDGASLLANPGCYPTSVLLALLPLLELLDPSQPIICDAKSGVSGAGKKADLDYSFVELSGNFKAYGIGRHRHEPEIRQRLGLDASASLVFVPHLLPIPRGILSTIHVAFREPVDARTILGLYESSYGGAPFVRIRTSANDPQLRNVVGTPYAEVGATLLEGGRRAVVVSVIDNLLKGAASQAVQNFNRIHQFDETEGLQ